MDYIINIIFTHFENNLDNIVINNDPIKFIKHFYSALNYIIAFYFNKDEVQSLWLSQSFSESISNQHILFNDFTSFEEKEYNIQSLNHIVNELLHDLPDQNNIDTSLKTDYEKYASSNDIHFCNNLELLYKCNLHKQQHLKDTFLVSTAIKDSCNDNCIGWYISNHRCECGNYKDWYWEDDDFNPFNWEIFNINSIEPYGYLSEF